MQQDPGNVVSGFSKCLLRLLLLALDGGPLENQFQEEAPDQGAAVGIDDSNRPHLAHSVLLLQV